MLVCHWGEVRGRVSESAVPGDLEEAAAILDRNYRIFQHYNTQRVSIMRKLTPEHRDKLLHIVPFLFHTNQPGFPGWVADLGSNPGVHGFRLSDETRNLRKEFFPQGSSAGTGVSRTPMIDSLAFIGSAGTLAQNAKSDFDIWVTCSNTVTDEEYALLRKKADLIHAWLRERDPKIDLNFYLGTPAKVKAHNFGTVSDDSAGSALGRMLKEEFYRSCVCWVGKTPLWWILPTNVRSVADYEAWVSVLPRLDITFAQDLMDMGQLERSSTEQLLSAVMWQANKSLKSPFKSLLKLTLVTVYADSPDGDFLAEIVKRNVQDNPTHGDATDPYYCLFEACAKYWQGRGEEEAVRLCADNFYRKTIGGRDTRGIDGSDTHTEVLWRKSREIRDTLRDYGLDKADMLALDNIENWDFKKALAVRERDESFVKRIFDGVLMRLERRGIKFADGQVSATREGIDESVLNLLREFANISHKVDCFYGKARSKVEPIPPGYASLMEQQTYVIDYDDSRPRWKRWALIQDLGIRTMKLDKSSGDGSDSNGNSGLNDSDLMVAGSSASYILCWLAANRLASTNSNVKVAINGQRKPVSEVRRLLAKMTAFFKHPLYLDELPEETFKQPPRPFKLFVSFDMDSHSQLCGAAKDFSKMSSRMTTRLPQLGTDKIPTISRITLVSQDTYGVIHSNEVEATRYTIAHLMARMLRDFGKVPLEKLEAHSMFHSADTQFHHDFIKDFQGAFKRAHEEIGKILPRKGLALRYITRVGRRYVVITREGEQDFRAYEFVGMRELMALLEQPSAMPVQTVVDPVVRGPERLRVMLSRYVPGRIQIFLHPGSHSATLYVVDEAGALFSDAVPMQTAEAQLNGLMFFLNKMPSGGLRYALVKDGRLQISSWDIIHREEGGDFTYHVSSHVASKDPNGVRGGADMLYIRISGSLNLREPHKAELITRSEKRSLVLPADTLLQTLAKGVQVMMTKNACSDFCILQLEQTEAGQVPKESVELLTLRRAIDQALRKLIQAQTVKTTAVLPNNRPQA